MAFYTNQCLEETRRIGRDDGKLLIDHFIQMSQTQCSYINQTHVLFADFLSRFQDHAEEASSYEQDVGGNYHNDPIYGNSNQIEESKGGQVQPDDGGSGGTGKVEYDDIDNQRKKKKKRLELGDVIADTPN